MNKTKAAAIIISIALLLTVAFPNTFAASIDQDSGNSESDTSAAVTEAATETVTEAATEGETSAACTCDPKPVEGEDHKEGCPLYAAQTEPETAAAHLDTCSDSCTDEGCLCECHLFDRILACQTLDEIWELLDGASDAAIAALTDEQNARINARMEELEPAPTPAVVIGESEEAPVQSEIVYQTVNYTDVAPFGEPVTGDRG